MEPDLLSVHVTAGPGRAEFALAGEMDADTAVQFLQVLDRCEIGLAELVVVDLSALSYLDSSGIAALVQVARRVSRSGGRAVFTDPSEWVWRVLEMMRLNDVITVVRSADAVA